MFEGIIYCESANLRKELQDVIIRTPRIEVQFFETISEIHEFLIDHNIVFFLIAVAKPELIKQLVDIYKSYPQIYFIYYCDTMNVDNFQYSDFSFFSNIIVGEKRKTHFQEILANLSKNYWKKIPYDLLDLAFDKLSPRMKKVMNYIETHELKKSNIARISTYLNISQGYFSQEFKRETGYTFRRFMQQLLDHYERIIFDRLDISAKAASQILGYSELSSFSRSFKKRKGYPPSLQKTNKYAETHNN